jgi:trigger factor
MSSTSSHSHASHAASRHDEHVHPGLTVAVEKKEKGKAEVTLTVPFAELERARTQEFARFSQRVALKGFRPGKTPRAMLEKHFGGEVEKNVLEHFLQHGYDNAVKEHALRPAAFPRITLEGNLPKKGEPWSLTFTILLRPELKLGQIEGLEVEGRDAGVTDEELERALVELRRSNSRAEPADDEPLAAEGMAVATLDFFRPDSLESCLTREGIRLAPKSPPQGMDPAAFEEVLVGAKRGEQRTLPLEFPANFPVEEARGEKGRVRFTLTEVMRIVPPADEELFRAFAATDEATLRAAVRVRMQEAKQENEAQRIEGELLERLLEAHPMELPEQLVLDQIEAHQAELLEKLKEQGLSDEEAAKRAEGERERSRTSADKALRAVYLIEEIARAKELKVTAEDVTGEMHSIAERNGTTPEEVAKYYREQGLLRQLGLELLERKVRRYLRASAAIRAPAAG